ncbi:MAG: rhodanese-like domain-containing protein [Leeuwenhoekiella sp.]
MKKLSILLLFILTGLSAKAQQQEHTILETSVYKDSIEKKKVLLLDVRTPEEFKAGHIDRAINYNYLDTENFKKQVDSLSKNRPVYIYCRSGNRSGRAADLMKEMGFTKIFDLKGGYLGWEAFTEED